MCINSLVFFPSLLRGMTTEAASESDSCQLCDISLLLLTFNKTVNF